MYVAHPALFGALLAHALELGDLAFQCGPHQVREVTAGDSGPVMFRAPVVRGALELAQLLANGFELAAQQELTLRLLHPFLDAALYLLAQGQVAQRVPCPAEDQPQAGLDLDRLEHLDLLGQREIRRVPGQVSDLRGLGDVPQPFCDLPGAPREQDVLEHGPVLAGQLRHRLCRRALTYRVHLDPQRLPRPGDAGTDGAP